MCAATAEAAKSKGHKKAWVGVKPGDNASQEAGGAAYLEAQPLQLQVDAVGLVSTRGLAVADEAVERAARRERHR